MAGELRDNAEAKSIIPNGAESSGLVVSNGEMAAFQGNRSSATATAEREQAMFGNGFDFGRSGDIYGDGKTLIAQASAQAGNVPENLRQQFDAPAERLRQQGLIDESGNWHFQNPRVKPGQDLAGAMKEGLWNTLNPSPGKMPENNTEFFYQFISGTGKTIQDHTDKNDPVLKDFIHSPGADAIRKQFSQQGFPATTDKLGFGTWQAFEETVAPEVHQVTPTGLPVWTNFKDWSSVGTQVGGFGNPPKDYPWATASATRCGADGKPDPNGDHVNYSVINLAGRKSFMYHMDTPLTNDKPLTEGGPMRTIVQRFNWIEPIPAADK